MNNLAEVYLWGTRVGVIHYDEDRGYASFEYDKDFVKGAGGTNIELSPLQMPISDRIYEFPGLAESFHGVPGMIADSLPDKFGNAIIKQWLVSQGREISDFNVIDRLCYTGSRGMGALEYVPALGPEPGDDAIVNVSEMVRFASEILKGRSEISLNLSDEVGFSQLLRLGTSAGGARAKAIIAWNEETNEIRSGQIDAGEGFDYWIMKFDGVTGNGDHDIEDKPQYTLIEYAYYKMAVEAGIEMMPCRILSEGGRNHFMTKRFDRVDGGKLHMQTLGAIAHIDYNVPGLCSYEEAAMYMRKLGLTQKEIEQFFKRMVFNVLAVNQDDHVKNISFLMDRGGTWRLSPAYDVTFSYDAGNRWLKAHQMTINGKSQNIEGMDIENAGKNMGISTKRIKNILEQVERAVSRWETIADEVGISEKAYKAIQTTMNKAGL